MPILAFRSYCLCFGTFNKINNVVSRNCEEIVKCKLDKNGSNDSIQGMYSKSDEPALNKIGNPNVLRFLENKDASFVSKNQNLESIPLLNSSRSEFLQKEKELNSITSGIKVDEALPGGLTADLMKKLSTDRDVASMLLEPKMQDIIEAYKSDNSNAIKRYLSDPG